MASRPFVLMVTEAEAAAGRGCCSGSLLLSGEQYVITDIL